MAESLPTPVERERPILFSGPMVRAILAGAKSQTRRLLKPQPRNPEVFGVSPIWGYGVPRPHVDRQQRFGIHAAFDEGGKRVDRWLPCPYGAPGDRLWVRETWTAERIQRGKVCVAYRASCDNDEFDFVRTDGTIERAKVVRWKPSIFMPREVSRITLKVTGVRVERLQDITESDAQAEGAAFARCDCGVEHVSLRQVFEHRWNELHGAGAFALNPFVWVVSFRWVIDAA